MSDDQLFFNIDDPSQGLFRELAPGLTTRVFAGEQAMLSIVSLAPNARGEPHKHPEEQWGILLEGDGLRVQGGQAHRVAAGDFWRTPANVEHAFIAGPRGAKILDVFSPPREEYRSPGRGFTVQE